MLISENDVHFRIKPIGMTADKDFRLWFRRVKAEILQRLKSEYGNLHFVHGIYKQKEPIVPQHIRPLQCQCVRVFLVNKIGMKILKIPYENLLCLTVPVNDQYLVGLGNDDLVPVSCFCFISLIRKRGLKYEVIAFL